MLSWDHSIIFALLIFSIASADGVPECHCGFGGLCLNRWPQVVVGRDCRVCEEISGGFYANCNRIKNHCDSNPCQNFGLCYQTWGSYYCKCGAGFCGQRCEYPCSPEFKILSQLGVSTHASVYYQIQPRPDGTNRFFIIFDPGDAATLLQHNIDIRINVSVSDGRLFFPQRKEFHSELIKSRCLRESSENPYLYDERICRMLSLGKKWVFPIDVTYFEGYRNSSQSRIIADRMGREIGVTGMVRLTIELLNLKNNNRYRLFDWTYKIFGYTSYRDPHYCKANIVFSGCSQNKEYPRLISRGRSMKIRSIFQKKHKLSCQGDHSVGIDWFIQRNMERDENFVYDARPRLAENLYSKYALIPPRTFDPGLHMFEFAENLRGDPPHYGGPTHFSVIGRCWMRVTLGEPMLTLSTGNENSARCHRDLLFKLKFSNTAYAIKDFSFSMICNNSNDPDCLEHPIKGYHLRKFRACRETYNFTIFAVGRKGFPNTSTSVLVYFKELDIELTSHCIFNCVPVDVNNRVLMRAKLIPYSGDPVSWFTSIGSSVSTQLDGHFDLFWGYNATRLYRVDGRRFVETGVISTDVTFTLMYNLSRPLLQVEKSYSLNIELIASYFNIQSLKNGTHQYIYSQTASLRMRPYRYRIYSIFKIAKLFYVAVDETYVERLTFESKGDSASLCLINAFLIEACTEPAKLLKPGFLVNEKRLCWLQRLKGYTLNFCLYWSQGASPTPPKSLEELEDIGHSGDSYRFLEEMFVFVKYTMFVNGTHMRWDASLKERKRLLLLLRGLREQHDVMTLMVFICTYLFSKAGSDYDRTLTYVVDESTKSDYFEIKAWLELRYRAMDTLKMVAQFFRDYTDMSPHLYKTRKVLRSPGGDTLQIMARAWALAFLKTNLEFKEQPILLQAWLNGEILFWTEYTFREFKRLSAVIGSAFTNSIVPYNGLRVLGGRRVRVYLIGDTYNSVVNYLNKSRPRLEKLPGFADFLFDDIGDDEWLERVEIELPIIDMGYSALFSLVVFAAEKQLAGGISSSLFYVQMWKMGENIPLKTLKDGELWFINLARDKSGVKRANEVYGQVDTIFQTADKNYSTPWRHMVAYKVTLPVRFQDFWDVVVRQHDYVEGSQEWHVKAKVSVGSQIEYGDVVTADPLKGDYGSNLSEKCMTSRVTRLYPRDEPEGKFVPTVFYIGLTLDSSVKPGSYHFSLTRFVPVCIMESDSFTEQCLRDQIENSSIIKDFSEPIRCACKRFGIIYPVYRTIRHVQLFYDPITFVLPVHSVALVVIVCVVLVICAVVMFLIAILFDIRRVDVPQIHYVEDAFPSDQHLVLIGVHTGMNLFAGSFSHVAIKIVGSLSSSRVHILNAQRKKSLRWLRDDWFVIPVNQPLGVIVNICMWHDFHLVSDWYCSRLIILDTDSGKWYFVEVERWFMLYDNVEESQFVMLLAEELDELATAMDRHEQSYSNYYIRELQNTHSPISMFTMHPRYIGFYEQKCFIFLVKVFGLFFSSWLLHKYGFATVFRAYDSEPARLTRVSGNTFPLILSVAVSSHIFTFPCACLHRWYVRSRAVQLRTTHPMLRHLSRASLRSMSQISQADVATGKVNINVPKRDSRKSLSKLPPTPRGKDTNHGSTDRARQPSTDRARKLPSDRARLTSTDRGSRTSKMSRYSSSKTPSVDRRSRLFSGKSVVHPIIFQSDRPGFWSYILGPSQMKSVNVPMSFFRSRMHLQIGARVAVGILLVFLIGFFLYVEIFTDFWIFYQQSIFFVSVGLLLDMVVLEPLFIFVKSLLAFSVFHFSNTEKHLLDQDIALDVSKTPGLTFAQYVQKVTRKRYKPYTTSQLAEKRHQQLLTRVAIFSFLYLCILAVAVCSYHQVSWVHKKAHWVFLKSVYHSYLATTRLEGPPASEVLARKSLIMYVVNNYIDWDFAWPNEKNISANGMRWGKERYSRGVGAMNVILQVLEIKRNVFQVHNELEPYVGESRLRLLESITTKPIMINAQERNYEVVTQESLRGGSRDYYPFAGHTLHLSLTPWPELYSDLRLDLNDIYEAELRGQFEIVAMIFTTNFVCPYLSGLLTVDLLYEDLPYGVSDITLQMSLTQVFDPLNYERYPGLAYRVANSCLNLLVLALNICIMCKVGVIKYFSTYHWIIHAVYVVALFMNALSSAFFYQYKFKGWEQVVDNPTDVYTELHSVYFYGDFIDSAILCFMFCMFTLEAALVMQWIFKLERLKLTKKLVFRMTPVVLILIIGSLQLYQMLCQEDTRNFILTPLFFFKESLPVAKEDERYFDWFLVPGFLVPLLIKFCTAMVVYKYLSFNLDEVNDPAAHPIKMNEVLRYIKTHRVPRVRASDDSRFCANAKTSVVEFINRKSTSTPTPSIRSNKSKKRISQQEATDEGKQKFQENLNRKFYFF